MKKRSIAIALAVLMITAAAGCDQAVTQVSQGEVSIVSTGLESTDKNEKTIDEVLEDIGQSTDNENVQSADNEKSSSNAQAVTTGSIVETADLFSDRDLEQNPDLSGAEQLTVSDGQTLNITQEGTYVISGSASNCTVKVDAGKESKVQIILDGVSITNENFPAIYVVSADKCFVTLKGENSLSVTGEFKADGNTNTDAVIFSKDDLVFNGTGSLTINSSANGISCKDDLKFTGGTYDITSVKDSVEAKDSISIYSGTFKINSSKDAFHSEDDEDDTKGTIYIADGTFDITTKSDSIQGTSAVQIDGGKFTINSSEGIEATYVQINGGTISIDASDDGINASKKSSLYTTPTIEVNGGELTIVMGAGDTDGLDANGDIIVNGGKIDVTAQMSSFDYDGKAEFNGGTIIVNGEEVDEIPQSMMPGGFGGMGGRGGMGFNGQMPDGEMPQMPDGEEPPEMPDGERPSFMPDGEMPSMPEGEQPDFSKFKKKKSENVSSDSET